MCLVKGNMLQQKQVDSKNGLMGVRHAELHKNIPIICIFQSGLSKVRWSPLTPNHSEIHPLYIYPTQTNPAPMRLLIPLVKTLYDSETVLLFVSVCFSQKNTLQQCCIKGVMADICLVCDMVQY